MWACALPLNSNRPVEGRGSCWAIPQPTVRSSTASPCSQVRLAQLANQGRSRGLRLNPEPARGERKVSLMRARTAASLALRLLGAATFPGIQRPSCPKPAHQQQHEFLRIPAHIQKGRDLSRGARLISDIARVIRQANAIIQCSPPEFWASCTSAYFRPRAR